jgi:hypothetical protein
VTVEEAPSASRDRAPRRVAPDPKIISEKYLRSNRATMLASTAKYSALENSPQRSQCPIRQPATKVAPLRFNEPARLPKPPIPVVDDPSPPPCHDRSSHHANSRPEVHELKISSPIIASRRQRGKSSERSATNSCPPFAWPIARARAGRRASSAGPASAGCDQFGGASPGDGHQQDRQDCNTRRFTCYTPCVTR